MCLWKMPPSVNRKFAFFAIFFEKSVIAIFNILILFIFIVFMQKAAEKRHGRLFGRGLLDVGPHGLRTVEAGAPECRAGSVLTRNRSAERLRPRGGSGGKGAFFRTGVLALRGLLLESRGSIGAASGTGPLQVSFMRSAAGRRKLPAEDSRLPAGRAQSAENKELPTKTVNSSERADSPAKKPVLRRACVSGDCPRGEGRAFSARFPGRRAPRA